MFHPETERLIERVLQLRQQTAELHRQHHQAIADRCRLSATAAQLQEALARLQRMPPGWLNSRLGKRSG